MKKQLQGIAIILVSILLMLGFGNEPVFDLSFRWSVVFSTVGLAGVAMLSCPTRNNAIRLCAILRRNASQAGTHFVYSKTVEAKNQALFNYNTYTVVICS